MNKRAATKRRSRKRAGKTKAHVTIAGAIDHTNRNAVNGIPTKQYQALVNEYRKWIYICTSRNATAVAQTPLRVFATRSTGQARSRQSARVISGVKLKELKARPELAQNARLKAAVEVEELFVHPLITLLNHINPFDSTFDHFEGTQTFLELTGDAYWYIVANSINVPVELWTLPSQFTTIVPDAELFIKGYLFGRNVSNRVAFTPEEIVHFKFTNPNSLYYGWSPLEAVAAAQNRYNEMDTYEKSLLDNRGQLGIVVQFDGKMEQPQRLETEIEFNNAMRGSRNAGRIKIIDERFKLIEFGKTPQDISFLAGRKWTRMEIAAAYSVPLALVDVENVNKANASAALHQYYKFGISPRLAKMAARINSDLVPRFSEDRLFVAFDDVVPEDQLLAMRQENQDVKNFVLSVNEVRMKRGEPPVEWGDVPWGQANLIQLGDEPPPPPPPVQLQLAAPAVKHAGDCGCGACPTIKRVGDIVSDELVDVIAGESGGPNPALSASEQGIVDTIEGVWLEQQKIVGKLGSIDTNDLDQFNDVKWIDDMVEGSTPFMRGSMITGGRSALNEVADELTRPLETALEQFLSSSQLDNVVENSAFKFAKGVSESVVDKLKDKLSEQIADGDSLAEIKKGIMDVFDGQISSKRAWNIARTETARVQNLGKVEAWAQEGFTTKEWLPNNDACPFCTSLINQQIGMTESFFTEGEELKVTSDAFSGEGEEPKERTLKLNYGDVVAPPLHPGCRCAVVPVFAG